MRMSQVALLAAVLTSSVSIAHEKAPAAPTEKVVRRALGGAGGWDDLSVDGARHRLYLSRSDRVVVMDTQTGKVVGELPNTGGVHGIALVADLGVGFTSNGKTDSVTAFELETLKPLGEIKVSGNNPDAILYDPFSKRVIVFNGRSANATLIDPVTRAVVATVALPGKPEFARTDGHGRVFVNIEDKGEISVIDPKAATVVATWSLGDCEEPSGLALDYGSDRLFSVCQNGKMVVTDANTGKHVADVPIGAGPDGAAVDVFRRLVFSPNGKDGTLTVVHEDDANHYHVIATLPTQKSARTMVLDEASQHLYLPAAEFDPLPAKAPPHIRPPMKSGTFTVLDIDIDYYVPGVRG